MTYPQVTEGQWVNPVQEGYKMACCDCGLVHRLDFKVAEDGFVSLRAFRDNRATAAIRRERKKRAGFLS